MFDELKKQIKAKKKSVDNLRKLGIGTPSYKEEMELLEWFLQELAQEEGKLVKNYLIDIDGTVTDDIPNEEPERMVTCLPKPKAVQRVNSLYDRVCEFGGRLVFFTSRTYNLKEITEDWLNKHGFKYHYVIYNKPRGGNYVWIDNLDVEFVKYVDGYWG